MKGNVIQMNTLHLNSVRLNGIGKVQSVSLKGGSTEDPVFPPVEPPVEPTPTYTLSASVTNGKVSAKRNGSAVNLPFTANEGDVIIVEVTPNEGYTFEGWADGNTDNPRTITMTADVVLSAQCVEVVQPPVGNYIQFEDPAVEAICVANWSSDGIGLTEEDAAKVTSLGAVFKGNTSIRFFDELQYFTGLTPYLKPPTTWNDGAFYNCTSLERVTLPPNATILSSDFRSCKNLREVRGLEQITDITSEAFNTCSALAMELNLENLKTIANASFTNSGIVAILSLGKVKSIPGSSTWNYTPFANCTSLKTAVLPSTLESLGDNVFNNCKNMEWMKVLATTPPSMSSTNTLLSTNNCPIYVSDASLEAYKTATNWNTYADRIHPLSEIEGSLVFYDKLVGDGTAYINTEYYAKGTDNFAWDAEKPTSWNKFIFGTKSSALNLGALPINIQQTYYLVGSAGATAASEENSQRVARAMQVLTIDGSLHRVLTDNGVQTKDFGVVGSYADKTSSAPLLLFACQTNATNATADRIYNGAIRSFSITDIDGNTIMSLKPCTWNGEAGMWDEVGNKFYGNSSTNGEFSVANDE